MTIFPDLRVVQVPAGTAGNDAARGIIDVEDESLEDELAKLVEEQQDRGF